ncbi:MAG TPA: SRPBCC family protein [Acidimicrobiales bacterium]|nr:SRPBCC family protein [Acidimicrobiales bacterium]
MRLEHELLINAPVDTVWALTLDVERWPESTPTITEVVRLDDGPLTIGSQARIKQPGQGPRVWTVSRLEAPHEFEWGTSLGTVRMRGGHHLAAEGDGCRNRLTLELEGVGSRLLGLVAGRAMRNAIARENEGFKATAEARVAST